jgi:hypothetical protein
MTANSLDGDFATVDTAMLNRYFREYCQAHGQGGMHTQQRNLLQLFNYLQLPATTCNVNTATPTPYTAGSTATPKSGDGPGPFPPAFIDDLLEVTGGGKARDFETARDHAIIRILRSGGIRRQELLGMVMHTLPGDLLRTPSSAWYRSKAPGTPGRTAGQPSSTTARALAIYRRAHRSHKLADSDWVWSEPEIAIGSATPESARY